MTRGQLLEIGFSVDQVKRMRASHRLIVIHEGVYAVGHRRIPRAGHWLAAVLASGPGARLSHRSGAALRGLRRTSIAYVEVTVTSQRAPMAGIRHYVNTRLAAQDRQVIDGVPCASPALLLLQLAAVTNRRSVERAMDEAVVQRVFDLRAVEDVLDRFTGCRGAATLRAVLREHTAGTTLTRPGLEEQTLGLLDRHGITRPFVNADVVCRPGISYEVDFLWRNHRLVLETDGGRFHSTRNQIERDRRKESDLVRAGYRVLRATSLQVEREPQAVALMVGAALRQQI